MSDDHELHCHRIWTAIYGRLGNFDKATRSNRLTTYHCQLIVWPQLNDSVSLVSLTLVIIDEQHLTAYGYSQTELAESATTTSMIMPTHEP